MVSSRIAAHLQKAILDVAGDKGGETVLLAIDSDIDTVGKASLMPVVTLFRRWALLKDHNGEPLIPGLKIIQGKGSDGELMRKINTLLNDRKMKLKKERIYLIGDNDNIRDHSFSALEGVSWLVGLDAGKADHRGYLPVIESITMALMISLGADMELVKEIYDSISTGPVSERELEIMISNRVIRVLPVFEKYGSGSYEEVNGIFQRYL